MAFRLFGKFWNFWLLEFPAPSLLSCSSPSSHTADGYSGPLGQLVRHVMWCVAGEARWQLPVFDDVDNHTKGAAPRRRLTIFNKKLNKQFAFFFNGRPSRILLDICLEILVSVFTFFVMLPLPSAAFAAFLDPLPSAAFAAFLAAAFATAVSLPASKATRAHVRR